eukprot:11630437-Alexandrium_andersonii.AAC.1
MFDPGLSAPVKHVSSDVKLHSSLPELRSELAQVWPAIARTHAPKVNWGKAHGLLAATYVTLKSAGWVPLASDNWQGPEGSDWQLQPGAPVAPF